MNEEKVKFLTKQRNLYHINDNLIKSEIIKLQSESISLAGKAFCFAHFQYLKNYLKNITFEEAAFFSNSSLANLKSSTSLSLFKKPSFKDRISHLIHYFITNPGIFSQVLYFTLTGVDIIFDQDDYYYFFLHTFPSIYSYFIDTEEANNAIELIKITLRYHFSLNKSSIKNDIQKSQNDFVSWLIKGFVSASNPSVFFKYLNIDFLLFPIQNQKSVYSVVNGKLVRADYWKSILHASIEIVDKMIKGINLLPPQIRKLFSVLNEVNSDFTDFYIFGIFFHDYINCKSFCDVIDCSYRQGWYNRTPLYDSMEGIWDLTPLREKLQQFKKVILTNNNPVKHIFETNLILSTRDINLVLKVASYSVSNLNILGFDDLGNLCDNLDNVFHEIDEKIVVNMRKWCFVSKFAYQNEDNFPPIFNMLRVNPDKEKIKTIFKPFLSGSEIIQFDSYNESILDKEIEEANSIIENSQKILNEIYESEIYVDEMKKSLSFDLSQEVSIFFESRVSKTFIYNNFRVLLPLYQNVQISTVIEGIAKLYNFLIQWSKFMKLNQKSQKTLNRVIFDHFFNYFVNRVEFAFSFEEKQKMEMINSQLKDEKIPTNIQKASEIFERVSVKQSFKKNLYNIINAISKLKKETDKEIVLAISLSKNADLFWFGELAIRFLTERTVKDRIFYRYENEAIAIFLDGLIAIKEK